MILLGGGFFLSLHVRSIIEAPGVPLVSQQGSYVAIVLTLDPHKRSFQGPLNARWIVPKSTAESAALIIGGKGRVTPEVVDWFAPQ